MKVFTPAVALMTVNSFFVIVPVLSVQMMETEERVSTAFNFFANTFFLSNVRMPNESATEIAAGRPSGTTETDRASAKRKFSYQEIS
ncbi:MAG: hypothetical protein ACD_67C00194G0001 [uncultured bacterium]|nr:MAG: hypothetical protein ACD_67C00194G0001 [uncultured bacterium]